MMRKRERVRERETKEKKGKIIRDLKSAVGK
jgi:hypothetical protein